MVDRNKTLSTGKYLNEIGTLLKTVRNNLKKSVTWKIQLKLAINFMSSKDTNKEHLIHSKSFNIETTIHDKADQVIAELFELFCSRCQIYFQIAMKCNSFLFGNVHSLHCKFDKINLTCCGSYIIYPDYIKPKKRKNNSSQ